MSDSNLKDWQVQALELRGTMGSRAIGQIVGKGKSTINDYFAKVDSLRINKSTAHLPKVLVLDIETAPIKGYVWGLWQNNLGLNQIDSDWFILSYAAKWLGDPEDKVMYDDMRGIVDTEDDTHLLEDLWQLVDEADIVLSQNGKKFDLKKINARFILNGFLPPRPYKQIDTLVIAKQVFGFTSNKLEYMTDKICKKYKKLKHGKFSGFELWKQMMLDNPEAWEECEIYNKYDVLSLEELYLAMAAWDSKHLNFNLYHDNNEHVCRCGSKDLVEDGFAYTAKSKFQQYKCNDCGATTRGSANLFSKEKRQSLQLNILN